MSGTGIIGIIINIVTIFISYKGFTNPRFFEKWKFAVDRILIYKEYQRLFTSGFLHVGWTHLILNMISLMAFSDAIENYLGGFRFLIVYTASLVGGNLLSLLIHRNHGDYSSVGASGAVSGVIFASIALFPGISISFFFLPISIPAWIYGVAFIGYSMYGIRSKKDNIGHDAHLGGALIGMMTAILMQPAALLANYQVILLILIPTVTFIYLIITRPSILLIDNFFYNAHDFYSVDHKYNAEKSNKQQELDRILDKINRRGMGSLSRKERNMLKEYSKK
jgi:membrane associated rhomboid family serine protease